MFPLILRAEREFLTISWLYVNFSFVRHIPQIFICNKCWRALCKREVHMNFRQFFGTRMPVKVIDGILFKRNNSQTGQIDIYFLHCRLALGSRHSHQFRCRAVSFTFWWFYFCISKCSSAAIVGFTFFYLFFTTSVWRREAEGLRYCDDYSQ